jgi:hypothetical protein
METGFPLIVENLISPNKEVEPLGKIPCINL